MSPDDIDLRLELARDALDAGDLATAEREAGAVLVEASRGGEDLTGYAVDAELVLAEIDVVMRDDEQALQRFDRVRRVAPDDPELAYLEGHLRLLRWEVDAAERLLRSCPTESLVGGPAVYLRAVIAELRHDDDAAERLYVEAVRLDPESCRPPVRIEDQEAHSMLGEIVRSMPRDVRAALDNVQIDVVDVPDERLDAHEQTDPFLLGLYEGVPIGESSGDVVGMPPRVRIFKRSIERLAGDRDELIEQLRITLLHEIGHHLGWDEDDLAERGLA